MKITGVMPLRNATKLGYPYELALRSLRPLCDEVVVLVDPSSEDDTLARVRALDPDKVVESVWDMTNHEGHTNCEISVQTAKAVEAASGDWVFSLQADEVLHESDAAELRRVAGHAERAGVTGLELTRLYFYGSLAKVRLDWSLWLLRFFKRGCWKPDVDGAMRFDPVGVQRRWQVLPNIYHYSRVGDPQKVAERVRNLDTFFHAPEKVAAEVGPYDYGQLRKLDTYVVGAKIEEDRQAQLVDFEVSRHPRAVREMMG